MEVNMTIKRTSAEGFDRPSVLLRETLRVPYMQFAKFCGMDGVKHLFTTRLGGVSTGKFCSMNLSFTRGDEEACVLENYRRVAQVMGCKIEDMVCSHQTHTTNIRKVTGKDRGKGICIPRDYEDVDGLVTDNPGVCLALFFADCVPVYFVDPVKKVIGLAHSGWKGTVGRISEKMIAILEEEYGCNPANIKVAIGPSICQECYEVSRDVAEQFQTAFKGCEEEGILLPGKEAGKYQLSLWLAVERTLREAGVAKENIIVTDVCTCCNPQLLFSHRASKGERGNLGAFLMLC